MAEERFSVEFRFYAELGDFILPERRGRRFTAIVTSSQSVKHAIEALGVPHTEVGLLLVNGEECGLERLLQAGDSVAVLPALRRLLPYDGDVATFAADSHLGRLARYLRFAGFDTLWDNGWDDAHLAAIAAAEGRIVLTRDRALLMHKALKAGFFVRDRNPLAQLSDVARRYALDLSSGRPARCLVCNGELLETNKSEVAGQLLPGTLAGFDSFWRCSGCRRVFWRGSHWRRLHAAIDGVARTVGAHGSG